MIGSVTTPRRHRHLDHGCLQGRSCVIRGRNGGMGRLSFWLAVSLLLRSGRADGGRRGLKAKNGMGPCGPPVFGVSSDHGAACLHSEHESSLRSMSDTPSGRLAPSYFQNQDNRQTRPAIASLAFDWLRQDLGWRADLHSEHESSLRSMSDTPSGRLAR